MHFTRRGRVALALGRAWVPAPPDILEPKDAEDHEALDRFSRFCEWEFRWILDGGPAKTAERLLESLDTPGEEPRPPSHRDEGDRGRA